MVDDTHITIVFMGFIGENKPIYNVWGPHMVEPISFEFGGAVDPVDDGT